MRILFICSLYFISLIYSFYASSNTLVFVGSISSKTCDVSVNGSAASPIILLPTQLSKFGKMHDTTFSIKMKNCGVKGENLQSKFIAEIITLNEDIPNLFGTQPVELKPINGVALKKITRSHAIFYSSAVYLDPAGNASIPFVIRYQGVGNKISGSIVTSTLLLIVYN